MRIDILTVVPELLESPLSHSIPGRAVKKGAVEILEGDTPEILQRRVMEQAEWIILPQSVEKISKEIILH